MRMNIIPIYRIIGDIGNQEKKTINHNKQWNEDDGKKNFNIVCHNFKNIFDIHSINKFIDVMLDAEQRSTLEMLLHLDSETKIVRTPFAIDELFKNFFFVLFWI